MSNVEPFPSGASIALDTVGAHDVFCDWITIYQDHFGGGLPVLNDGYMVRFAADAFTRSVDLATGALRAMFDASKADFTVSQRVQHEGSFDTRLSVRCDGTRVELSGNVGRFGRRDNVFGLPVLETIERANEILAALGLSPFSHNEKNFEQSRTNSFHTSHNAVITRVDLTANYAAGSRQDAFRVLNWMSGQATQRNAGKNPINYGNGITWNEGSKRHYEKLYYKADELGMHVAQEVRDYCEQNGILRYEVSIKSKELARYDLQNMVTWSKVSPEGLRMDNVIFGKFSEVLTRNQVSVTDLGQIPGKLGLIARLYIDGNNPYESQPVGLSTRRRWRAKLLPYGLDIAQPIDVTRIAHRVRIIELQPLAAPDWYQRTAA